MAIKYQINKNINSLNTTKEAVYYAKAISTGEVTSENLLTILSKKTRLHKADCLRFMMYLEETLNEQLQNGKIVRLGDLGSFQVGISSKGVDATSKVNSSIINNAKINFRAGKSFRKLLKELEFKKLKK
jgi:predicted histone-like DNA-binding protein